MCGERSPFGPVLTITRRNTSMEPRISLAIVSSTPSPTFHCSTYKYTDED